MPAHVRSDVRQLFPIDLVVAIHRMVESVLSVHRHFRHAILVQIQKPCVTANHLLYPRCFPVLQDRLKAAEYFLCHGELSCACICLGRLDHVLHFGGPLQLLVDVDDPLLHIEIVDGQSTELRDSHSCMEQYVECLVVSAVVVIVVHKLQELAHLVFGDSLSRHAVVDHHPGKLEPEWILLQVVVIDCHLEGRTKHASHCFDTAVSLAISLHLDQEELRVRGLYILSSDQHFIPGRGGPGHSHPHSSLGGNKGS